MHNRASLRLTRIVVGEITMGGKRKICSGAVDRRKYNKYYVK